VEANSTLSFSLNFRIIGVNAIIIRYKKKVKDMTSLENKIAESIRPIVEDLGYELYDVIYEKEGKDNYLRVFINKEDGISLNDCENVNNSKVIHFDYSDINNYLFKINLLSSEEMSMLGKLSKITVDVNNIDIEGACLEGSVTVVDAKKCKMYQKNFGEFWGNQIENADCIILSHTKGLSPEKLHDSVERVRSMNDKATLITTDWDELTGAQILAAINRNNTLSDELEKMKEEAEHEHHHHHEDGEECCCGHNHDHEHEHHHHHHEDGEECCCGHDHEHEHEHHHHHEDGEECCCGHDHDHEHHHHHHHADDVFTSWGKETAREYSEEEIASALAALENEEKFGFILRAKGIVSCTDGSWIHFDYVPGTPDIRRGSAGTIGRLCVIGSKINEDEIAKVFFA